VVAAPADRFRRWDHLARRPLASPRRRPGDASRPVGTVSGVPTTELLSAADLRRVVVTYRDVLHAHAPAINRLNVYPVPDGDTGTNMSRTLDAVVDELAEVPDELGPLCAAIGHGSLMGARGNSGVILSQVLRGLTAVLRDAGEVTAGTVAAALEAASRAADQAVLRPIEGTILTVVREAGSAAARAAADGADLVSVLRAARAAGGEALARTPELLPVLAEAGVVDAGGAGFLLLLDASLHVVAGDELPQAEEVAADALPAFGQGTSPAAPTAEPGGRGGEAGVADLRYEVMYLLDLDDARIGEFKAGWGAIGGSIVVVGGEGLWNCHVHTDDIGAAVEVALDLGGRPRRIRVTDLHEEVAEEHAQREASLAAPEPGGRERRAAVSSSLPPVATAVVAVASGDGLCELFGQLGVQGVVTGGQTLNPSTAELLAAVEAVNSRAVVVLPNNGNIVPVAGQLDALTSKSVLVVPTRSMPEGLAALVVYDPEASPAANLDAMTAAAESVATGEVTQAVRDTGSDAGPVAAGDWIGLVRGDGVVAVAGDPVEASVALLDRLVTPEREIVTVVTGADATGADIARVRAWLAERRPDVDVEVHHGGQPLYPFLFGVE